MKINRKVLILGLVLLALTAVIPRSASALSVNQNWVQPNPIDYGGTSAYSWSVSDADDCDLYMSSAGSGGTSSGPWSFINTYYGTSGSFGFGPIYADTWFKLNCTNRQTFNPDDHVTAYSPQLHVNPIVTLSVNGTSNGGNQYSIDPSQNFYITWSTTVNAATCQWALPWNTPAGTSGTYGQSPSEPNYPGQNYTQYTLRCSTAWGSIGEQTVYVKQNGANNGPATVNLLINGQHEPVNVQFGDYATAKYTPNNFSGSTCDGSVTANGNANVSLGNWSSGMTAVSPPPRTIGPFNNQSYSYYNVAIDCNPTDTVTVNVALPSQAVLNVYSINAANVNMSWAGGSYNASGITSTQGAPFNNTTYYYTKSNGSAISTQVQASINTPNDLTDNNIFSYWSGCDSVSPQATENCNVSVNPGQVKNIYAYYTVGTGSPTPPPPSGEAILRVKSTGVSGVVMGGAGAADKNGQSINSTSDYVRTYLSNTNLLVVAPPTSGIGTFQTWNGCDSFNPYVTPQYSCNVQAVVGQDKTVTAVYNAPPSNGSDLTAINLVITPNAGGVYLDSAIKNIGTNAAGGSSIARLWLDWNNNGSWDFQNFSGQTVGNLASGETQTLGRWSLVPPAGPNKYRVCADNDAAIIETNETNNCADVVFDTTSADLVVSSITISPNDCADNPTPCSIGGQNSTISAVLKNQGGQSTTYAFGYSYSLDINNNGSWDQGGTNRTGYIDPGQTRSIGPLFSLTLPVGVHKIYVCADNVGEIAEGDESNNCTTKIINVVASAQPMVYSLSRSNAIVSLTKGTSPSGVNDIIKTLTSGTPQPVSINFSGVPSGVSRAPANDPCSPTCTATYTFTTDNTTTPGDYTVNVTGTPAASNNISFTLRINAGAGGLTGINPTVSGTAPGISGLLGTFVCSGAGTGTPKAYLRTPTTYSVTATGGIAPYTYYWTVGSASEVSTGSTNSYTVTYDTLGNKTVSARFVDSEGSTGTCTFSPNVGIVFNPNIGEF